MQYYSFAPHHRDSGWFLDPISGALHQINDKYVDKFKSNKLPKKVLDALEYCNYPYNLEPPNFSKSYSLDLHKLKRINTFYDRIKHIRRLNFWLAILYAGIGSFEIKDSLEAFYLLKQVDRSALTDNEGCLNRTLAVAKSSLEFKKSGVLFIGADLPQASLHSWIIENNYQPDPWDRDWINYLPIAAYAY